MDLLTYYSDLAVAYPEYITQKQFCEVCGICHKTAYNLTRRGEISYEIVDTPTGRIHHIKLTDALAYLYKKDTLYGNDENVNRQIYEVLQAHFSYLPDLLRTQQIRELTGFSMTAIRAKLLELGIPENEIAFIHNAKSEAQKKDLFGKVRSGQVRILLGSTQRMGAGTNCQQKLIALHHLECPWRPSDLQQREGRIIRQGNENPEVDIYSYVTEGTFDAYLYQLVESKQKFISQIMTSKSPVRSAEDVDEQALSYAEIKALASGNPMIKEKMDLDIEVSKLKLLKANHLSQKYALEDAISKGFPKQIAETQARITGYGADIATVKGNTHPNADGFSPLTLAGVTHADKKEAGAALLTMCQTMLSPEATQVGSYRGLTLELAFDTFAREYRLTMIGQLRHTVTLGTDVFGNLQRMDNALEGLPIKEQACREQLSNLQTQLETAKAEVQKPFPREAELNTKTARLEELNTLLNLDHKEPEIVDAEPDEDQRPPERRRPQLER